MIDDEEQKTELRALLELVRELEGRIMMEDEADLITRSRKRIGELQEGDMERAFSEFYNSGTPRAMEKFDPLTKKFNPLPKEKEDGA